MPYARFFEIIKAIEHAEKQKNRYDLFHTWQLVSIQQEKPVSFEKYYNTFFKETSKVKKENKEASKKIIDDIEALLENKRGGVKN